MSSAASRPPKTVRELNSQPPSPGSQKSEDFSGGPAVSQPAQPATSAEAISSSSEEADSTQSGLRQPPQRPQLMRPPLRPQPSATDEEPSSVPQEPEVPEIPEEPERIGPISAPSERLQYRAIGLLKGKYVPSEEQFNRGTLATADGTNIDAVLLGRVTSLVKKHLDLETEHVWVVYPRTLYDEEKTPALHVQIVGVWEPETLSAHEEEAIRERYLSTEEATEQCDRFSIRGEVAKYSEEKAEIVINIVQKSKSESAKAKRPFKLHIEGSLEGRVVGFFWDLEVEREGGKLVLKSAKPVAVAPPKRKPKNPRKPFNAKHKRPLKPRGAHQASKPIPKGKEGAPEAAAKLPAEGPDQASYNPSPEKADSKAILHADQDTPKQSKVAALAGEPSETSREFASELSAENPLPENPLPDNPLPDNPLPENPLPGSQPDTASKAVPKADKAPAKAQSTKGAANGAAEQPTSPAASAAVDEGPAEKPDSSSPQAHPQAQKSSAEGKRGHKQAAQTEQRTPKSELADLKDEAEEN